jgi:hypothetical protein
MRTAFFIVAVAIGVALPETSDAQLITIPGGGHGNFTPEQRTMIYSTIQQFLKKNGLMVAE